MTKAQFIMSSTGTKKSKQEWIIFLLAYAGIFLHNFGSSIGCMGHIDSVSPVMSEVYRNLQSKFSLPIAWTQIRYDAHAYRRLQVKKQCKNQLINNASSHQLIHLKIFHCLCLLDISTKDKWQVKEVLDEQWAHSFKLDEPYESIMTILTLTKNLLV